LDDACQDGPICEAVEYFEKELRQYLPEHLGQGIEKLSAVRETILTCLRLVVVTIEDAEQTYDIFHSLNAKGLVLAESDKIRNLCFMRVNPLGEDEVQSLYRKTWKPMEETLSSPRRIRANAREQQSDINDRFIFLWTTIESGIQFSERRLSSEFRAALDRRVAPQEEDDPNELAELKACSTRDAVVDMATYALPFRQVKWPEQSNLGDRTKEKLNRFRRLGIGDAAQYFLIELFRRYGDAGAGNSDHVNETLHVLESYIVWRRIAGIIGQQNNRILVALGHELRELPREKPIVELVGWTSEHLRSPSDPWPMREEVIRRIRATVNHFRMKSFTKEVLSTIDPRPYVDGLEGYQIEHILPKGEDNAWEDALGAHRYREAWDRRNALCNLTLIQAAHNQMLGAALFPVKQEIYRQYGSGLTGELADYDEWTPASMDQRAERLMGLIEKEWPRPL